MYKNIEELLSSEAYKNSNYILVKVNDLYALKLKYENKYLDLVAHKTFHWKLEDYYNDCVTHSEKIIIDCFIKRYPTIIKTTSIREITLDNINNKTKDYYKCKLLEL